MGEGSWSEERALVMNKINEFTENQKELFVLHHKLNEAVVIIKVKLGFIVVGISTGVSIVVGLVTHYLNGAMS